jgi:hypothetical protein
MDEKAGNVVMNTKAENTIPAHQPGKSLTISAKRLAGSAACLNCGTQLQGPFCYYCGQPDKNMMRFFPALLRELLEDTFDFDSRFARTLKPLLLKPGKLTRDYLDGRRFRYVPPLRLYIFSSIAFFFLAATLTSGAIEINTSDDDELSISQELSVEDQAKIEEALKNVDPAIAEEVNQSLSEEDDNTIQFNGEEWDRETNPLIVPLVPNSINDWVNDEIEKSPEKGRQIEENPNLITDKVFDVLPVTMFVLLPIVALLFKFWYLFAKKYYVEHLIFALHNHAFLFVLLLIMMLANSFAGWQEPSEEGPLSTAVLWFNVALWVWIPVYLLVSLKRVYQQGWWLTIGKFSCIGISYFMLLGLAASIVALISFVLL